MIESLSLAKKTILTNLFCQQCNTLVTKFRTKFWGNIIVNTKLSVINRQSFRSCYTDESRTNSLFTISFTLFPAHSRLGRSSVKTLLYPNPCWLAELNAAYCLDTRAKKSIYKFKKIFHFFEWDSNSQPQV